MKKTTLFAAGVVSSLLLALSAYAAGTPLWMSSAAERVEQAGIDVRKITAPLRQEGGSLADCAALIERQTAACAGYENWSLDIQVYRSTQRGKKIEISEQRKGPGNECLGTRAGSKYPANIQSETLDVQRSETGGEEQIICQVMCSGWVCPADEAEQERSFTCRSGTQKTDDCLRTCDFSTSSCRADPSQFDCSVCTPFEESYEESPEPEPERDCPEPVYDCNRCGADYDCFGSCEAMYEGDLGNYRRCMGWE